MVGTADGEHVERVPPENLRPAELALLLDGCADTQDVVATAVDLAARGYLTISCSRYRNFGSIDFTLRVTDKPRETLLDYEHELLTKIFRTNILYLSELRQSKYYQFKTVKEKIYQELVRKDLIFEEPKKMRRILMVIGMVMVFAGVLVEPVISAGIAQTHADDGVIAQIFGMMLLLCGIITIPISRFALRITRHGRDVNIRAKIYRSFIEQSVRHNLVVFENDDLRIGEYLAYAIVFGLARKLAKERLKLMKRPASDGVYEFIRALEAVWQRPPFWSWSHIAAGSSRHFGDERSRESDTKWAK
jgi:hypothetical protein